MRLVYEHTQFLLRIGIEPFSASRTVSTNTYFAEMSAERFKSYIALTIEQQTIYPKLVKAIDEDKSSLRFELKARHDKLKKEAEGMLGSCFADIVTIVKVMRAEKGGASEEEKRLADCRCAVATMCLQLHFPEFSDDDEFKDDPMYRFQELEQLNFFLFRDIRKYIRKNYLGQN